MMLAFLLQFSFPEGLNSSFLFGTLSLMNQQAPNPNKARMGLASTKEIQSMSKKQWYKDQWDKEVFGAGVIAWYYGKEAKDNPFDPQEEGIDYALWLLGWSYAMVND